MVQQGHSLLVCSLAWFLQLAFSKSIRMMNFFFLCSRASVSSLRESGPVICSVLAVVEEAVFWSEAICIVLYCYAVRRKPNGAECSYIRQVPRIPRSCLFYFLTEDLSSHVLFLNNKNLSVTQCRLILRLQSGNSNGILAGSFRLAATV